LKNQLPNFDPVVHGFPFNNSWEPGTPVVEIKTPLGTIPIGDASGGVCGGMVFAAADYYLFSKPIPTERSPAIFRYFCKRLLDSWAFPFGVLKYYDWQRRANVSQINSLFKSNSGINSLMASKELPKIRNLIDIILPVPLGVVKVHSWNPKQLARNHQILCFGYDIGEETSTLQCYDPNYPGETVLITISTADQNNQSPIEHSIEGKTVRGIFAVDYERPVNADLLPEAQG
jgi:hypothetical protein